MYCLYYFEQNYDGGEFFIVGVSPSKEKLEIRMNEIKKEIEDTIKVRERYSRDMNEVICHNKSVMKEFLVNNKHAWCCVPTDIDDWTNYWNNFEHLNGKVNFNKIDRNQFPVFKNLPPYPVLNNSFVAKSLNCLKIEEIEII